MFRWLGKERVIERAFRETSRGNVEGAIAQLRTAILEGDPSGDRAEALGMICYQAGRYEEAATALERAAVAAPENMMRVYYMASALARSDQLEAALSMLSLVANDRPTDVAPAAAQCLLLAERADYPAARSAWDRAQQIFATCPAQDPYSMGLLQQCAEISFPRPETK